MQVLASAEFYDLDTQQWETVGSMQVTRTEHLITLVYKDKDKDKGKDKDKDKVLQRPNVCYIFEDQWVQGFQI